MKELILNNVFASPRHAYNEEEVDKAILQRE